MKNKLIILMSVLALGLISCQKTNTSYSFKSKAEKKLIANFFSRNGIELVEELPTDEEFLANPNLYYHHQYYYGDFYYRLDKRGEKSYVDGDGVEHKADSLVGGETVVMRYKQYTLEVNPDTVSFWSTLDSPYPVEFVYLSDYTTACYGWHFAVGLMGYNESECTCIIPSRLGNSTAQNSVTPYGYKIKMWVKQ